MSKKKKDKVKAGKKNSAVNGGKKAVKKAEKLTKKKNAAKKSSKPEKKAKIVVKKSADKSKKDIKSSKKVLVKAKSIKKTAIAGSKNKIKALPAKKSGKTLKKTSAPAPKKAIKKVESKVPSKKVVAKIQKPAKKADKIAKPLNKVAPKAELKVKNDPKPAIKAVDKKDAAKPVASMGSVTKKDTNITSAAAKKVEPPVSKKAEEGVKKFVPEKRATDVLAISNTIPVKQSNELPASRIASISSSITNPIKKTDSYAVKPEKEPNGKFELEFVVHSSAEMLYEFLSTPSGLSEWFCDDLNIRNGIYTFIWDDQLQQARLLKTVDLQVVRFQWVDKTDGSYFEFRIQRDDLTNDISLIITDFAETVSDRESAKLLWHSQIEKLMHVIGSIF